MIYISSIIWDCDTKITFYKQDLYQATRWSHPKKLDILEVCNSYLLGYPRTHSKFQFDFLSGFVLPH